jgi:DNA-binding GntR family transcriptional regulator
MPKGSVSLKKKSATDTQRAEAGRSIEKSVSLRGPRVENGLAERAYAVIRERIVGGEYRMGQVISRRRIAADLGISFLPASEALLRLQWEGLLESRPRAGTRIPIPSRQDMQGHFVVREALQVQAATMFAQCATRAERAELMKLACCLDAGGISESTAPRERLTLHEKLHLKIAEYTHCEALHEQMRKQSALASAWLCAMGYAMPEEAQPRHEPLMKALTRHNSGAAAETMRAHVHAEMENTLRALEPSFEMNEKHRRVYSRTTGPRSRKRTAEMALEMESVAADMPAAHSQSARARFERGYFAGFAPSAAV